MNTFVTFEGAGCASGFSGKQFDATVQWLVEGQPTQDADPTNNTKSDFPCGPPGDF